MPSHGRPAWDCVRGGSEVEVVAAQFVLQVGGLGRVAKGAVNNLPVVYPPCFDLDLANELVTVFAAKLDLFCFCLSGLACLTDHS